jgi:hypothetical protein
VVEVILVTGMVVKMAEGRCLMMVMATMGDVHGGVFGGCGFVEFVVVIGGREQRCWFCKMGTAMKWF